MVEAGDINQLLAQSSSGSPTTPTAQQQLWRLCSRIVLERNGTIIVCTASGGAADAQEELAFSHHHTPHYRVGPVIVFDLSKAPPAPLQFGHLRLHNIV